MQSFCVTAHGEIPRGHKLFKSLQHTFWVQIQNSVMKLLFSIWPLYVKQQALSLSQYQCTSPAKSMAMISFIPESLILFLPFFLSFTPFCTFISYPHLSGIPFPFHSFVYPITNLLHLSSFPLSLQYFIPLVSPVFPSQPFHITVSLVVLASVSPIYFIHHITLSNTNYINILHLFLVPVCSL